MEKQSFNLDKYFQNGQMTQISKSHYNIISWL